MAGAAEYHVRPIGLDQGPEGGRVEASGQDDRTA